MTDSDEKQRALDASMENVSSGHQDGYGPMVQISIKENDRLKEKQHYITDKGCIDIIDNIERLTRALRKHIVRSDIE